MASQSCGTLHLHYPPDGVGMAIISLIVSIASTAAAGDGRPRARASPLYGPHRPSPNPVTAPTRRAASPRRTRPLKATASGNPRSIAPDPVLHDTCPQKEGPAPDDASPFENADLAGAGRPAPRLDQNLIFTPPFTVHLYSSN